MKRFYFNFIQRYLLQLDRRPYFNYMETMQCDVNQSMRLVLIDWLVEVWWFSLHCFSSNFNSYLDDPLLFSPYLWSEGFVTCKSLINLIIFFDQFCLLQVCIEDKYVPDTLYLSINILDRFLSKKAIFRDRLQLLGVASLFIAS